MKSFLTLRMAAAATLLAGSASLGVDSPPGRDPAQPLDEEYTKKIREYTTEPFFLSPLVEYLPGSSSVPTPKEVLGDVAGAPGRLPYTADVSRYMRLLEKTSPRVRVRSIGTSEEGREMIAVTIASEKLLAGMDANRGRLAKLADPRTIRSDDAEADRLVADSVPVYYITGAIHSPETGSPTALMELAYRLAVDDSPYIREIRDRVITVITPVVETDGRDRQVDVYNWHLAHPGQNWPPLVYWGKYVAHDNNRDGMALTLKLTRNVLNEFLFQKATVLHDLHESVPYLYDNTVGDGPYNAWLDPILTYEWQMLGWNNVQELTRFGMPGVFTHGTFDTWTPGYLMFLAATHNGISRLYETFGNGGADTVERTLRPEEYSRNWYRQNPPLPRVRWSQRNNNNYQQTGLLVSLHYFGENGREFLRNFYRKAKRAVEKPAAEGPAAYVFPADDPRPGAQAELLRILQLQGCEISRATAPFTTRVDVLRKPKPSADAEGDERPADSKPARAAAAEAPAPAAHPGESEDAHPAAAADPSRRAKSASAPSGETEPAAKKPKWVREARRFSAGSYVIRMDQPYSRIADMLLDYQYWSPDDPQKNPYDDTGWTFGELFHVQVSRVPDPAVLSAPMSLVSGPVAAPGGLQGAGPVVAIPHNGDSSLATLRYRFPKADFQAAEEPFDAAHRRFPRGSFLVRGVAATEISRALTELGLSGLALSAMPDVRTHPIRAPRIAMLHTWLSTQDEGWWRLAFDEMGIPYDSISTQTVAGTPGTPDLRARWDVIVFPPVGRTPQAIVSGMPMWGNPLPWKKTPETPNLGTVDQTDDMRPGLGFAGLEHLRAFVRAGGLVIGAMDTAELAVGFGLTPGLSIARADRLKMTGSVVRSKIVDGSSPIAYGYIRPPALYAFDGPIFNLSHIAGRSGRRQPEESERATGRGTADDPDRPTGRAWIEPPEEPEAEPWEALPLTEEQKRNGIFVIPPEARPRVVLRYGDTKELLVSGLVEGAKEIAQHPAVVDVPVERGHIVLFSNNPVWRGETRGTYALVWNAVLQWDSLNAGRR